MTTIQWKCGNKKSRKKLSVLLPAKEHPLINKVIERHAKKNKEPSSQLDLLTNALEGLDPLTQFAINEMDPLSKAYDETDFESNKNNKHEKKDNTNLWLNKKMQILNKFTTSKKISFVTNFLHDGEKIVVKQSSVVDEVQKRLEQLDYFDESSQKKFELTQAEYINKIDMLNKELVSAWNSEQRVKSLKIAIQCAKLLADTDVLPFYPSKFVLITEILDTFGKLVYDRLKSKAEMNSRKVTVLPDNFSPDMVPESAKETCLNWFYKISSIRELVPRMYVELALLKSYNFISQSDGIDSLFRITNMINGIGNPLVAIYIRCYLCKLPLNYLPNKLQEKCLLENYNLFLESYFHISNISIQGSLRKQQISAENYLDLFTPALEFILEGLSFESNNNVLNSIVTLCKKNGNKSIVLNSIFTTFNADFISCRINDFLIMISQSPNDGFSKSTLLRSLGICLSLYPPPSELRRPVLKDIWQHMGTFEDLGDYLNCIETWMPFIVQNFTVREVNKILKDIVIFTQGSKNPQNYMSNLKTILENIIQHLAEPEALFIMDYFLKYLDLFPQDSLRVELAKSILTNCSNNTKISDTVITNALVFLCNILHESIDALTPEDELRQIGQIVCNILRKVDYGRNFEQQLNFYVEARGSFLNIDSVLVELVQRTNYLMVKTRNIVQGYHSRKTADFVRACAAFSFITVPSIGSCKKRLELYLLSGQVALYNQCLAQADGCFKAILDTLEEIAEDMENNEQFILTYTKKFLSLLLIVPDSPSEGVLSLTRALLNILRHFSWNPEGCSLISIYLSVLDLLSTMAQESFPYHIQNVESNDALYGNDTKFINEIDKMCSIILTEILTFIKNCKSLKMKSYLSFELLMRIVSRSDFNEVNNPSLRKIASNLYKQIQMENCNKENMSYLVAKLQHDFNNVENS